MNQIESSGLNADSTGESSVYQIGGSGGEPLSVAQELPLHWDEIRRLGAELPAAIVSALIRPASLGSPCCAICRGVNYGDGNWCANCETNAAELDGNLIPLVAITNYVRDSIVRDCLTFYKSESTHEAMPWAVGAIESILQQFVDVNALALRLNSGGLDGIVVVPSTTRPSPHPLEAIAAAVTSKFHVSVVPFLRRSAEPLGHNQPNRRGFHVDGDVCGKQLLLLDDVYTTGARAQSAHFALTESGATVTALVTVARRFNLDYNPLVQEFFNACALRPFDWTVESRVC